LAYTAKCIDVEVAE